MKITNLKYPYLRIVLLALTVAISSLHADGFGPFTYEIDEGSGHVTITGYDNSPGDVVIPAEIDGKPVTKIGKGAFNQSSGLTSIFLPDSVTEIGSSAFAKCTGLSSITIPKSVTTIGRGAFAGCSGLTTISIPAGVTTIGDHAFSSCTGLASITVEASNPSYTSEDGVLFSADKSVLILHPKAKTGTYFIPDTVAEISDHAFNGCTGLTSVTIPEGVTSIGMDAFFGCSGLTAITIPDGITTINAFSRCTGLTSVTLPDSLISVGGFSGCTALTSVTIPDSVISVWGFSGCTALSHITFGERVEYIEDFGGCISLTSITIPDSTTCIRQSAFSGCTAIESVTTGAGVIKIEKWAFSNCTGLETVALAEGVTEIESCVFEGCTGLTSITIPASVSRIGRGAFLGCTALTAFHVDPHNPNLTSRNGVLYNAAMTTLIDYPDRKTGPFTFPVGVTRFEYMAFRGSVGLTSLNIPEGVTKIRVEAFSGCSALTNITIPEWVTEIGFRPFEGCTNLERIDVDPANANYSSHEGVLYNKDMTWLIRCPEGKQGEYIIPEGVAGWESCVKVDEFLGDVLAIHSPFSNCRTITHLTIPVTATTIGNVMFPGCDRLSSIVFLGNAPSSYSNHILHPDLTIYYLSTNTGFTSPAWHSYPAVMIDPSTHPAATWLLEHGLPHDTDLLHDHNGVGLLTAYALNLDPNNNPSSNLPVPRLSPDALTLTFHAATPGITYTVETSTDLHTWTTDGVSLSDLDAENQRTASVSRDSPKSFLRLVVSETP